MTSNTEKSMNAINKAARQLPIASLVECLRSLLQNWIWKHKQEAGLTKTKLAKKLETKLTENFLVGLKMICNQ